MKLTPIAFTPRELSDLNSVLDLAGRRLNDAWTITEGFEKDGYCIISLERAEELPELLQTLPDLHPGRIIAYIPEMENVAGLTLAKRPGSPPRMSEIMELLNGISQAKGQLPEASTLQLSDEPVGTSEEAIHQGAAGTPVYREEETAPELPEHRQDTVSEPREDDILQEADELPVLSLEEPASVLPHPDEAPAVQQVEEALSEEVPDVIGAIDEKTHCLVAMDFKKMQQMDWLRTSVPLIAASSFTPFPELLQQCVKDQTARLYSLHGEHFILVSPREGLFHFSTNLPNTLLLFRTFPDRIKTKLLPLKRIATHAERFAPHTAPIAKLLWLAALHDSQACPLPETNLDAHLRLAAVEPLADLPYFEAFSPLAKIWHSGFMNLETAANRSGEPIGKTVAFYNAAHLMQLFEAKPKEQTGKPEAKDTAVHPSLWQKIRGLF